MLASRLDLATLRRSEDSFVDELIAGVVGRGYPLVRAHFPRCFVDVNREPYELDPRMFDGRLPSFANTRSMRVAGGLGTVARVVGDAQEIYDQRISVDDALRRIEGLYKPYHRTLRRVFMRLHRDFGAAIADRLPFHAVGDRRQGRAAARRPRARRPLRHELRSGDRRDDRDDACAASAMSVSRNKPYAGGFITEHYGNPTAGLHAIQLEINRALYMDERRYERTVVVRAAGGGIRGAGGPARRDPARRAAALSRRRRMTVEQRVQIAAMKKGRSRLQAAQV